MDSNAVDMKERLRARIQARKMQLKSPGPEAIGQSATPPTANSHPPRGPGVPSAAGDRVVLVGSPNAKARERLKERRRSLKEKRELAKQTSSMPVQPAVASIVRIPVVNEFDLDSSDSSSDENNVDVPAVGGVSERTNRDNDDDADSLSVGTPSSQNVSSVESSPIPVQASGDGEAAGFQLEDANHGNASMEASKASASKPDTATSSGVSGDDKNSNEPMLSRGVQMSPRDAIEAAWIDVEMKKADDKFLEVTEELSCTEKELDDAQQALEAAKQRCRAATLSHHTAMRNLELAASTLRHLVKLKHGIEKKYSRATDSPMHAQVSEKDALQQSVLQSLHDHAMSGDFKQFQSVFEKHPSVAQLCIDSAVPPNHQTLLLTAARINCLTIVQFLLGLGANPNIADKYGMTPLHLAARLGNTKMFHLLLGAGAKPSSRNSDGLSPLDEMQQKSPRMFQAHQKNAAAVKKIHALESARGMQLAEMLALGIQLPDVPILSSNDVQGMCIAGAAVEHHSSLLRSMLWKLLLAYLPWAPSRWEFAVFSRRVKYRCLRSAFTPTWRCMSHPTNPTSLAHAALSDVRAVDKQDASNEFAFDDLPTMELRRQIYVDLMRMRQDFPASHRNAVARILFIFAKMHPDISYVQGMHDVCAALYYQFLHDNKKNIRGDDLDTSPNASADDDVIGPNIQEGGGTAPEAARSRPTSPSADTAADEAKYFLSDHDMFGGVDLHSDDAVETLLADPERMRRMLQTIGHVENSDVMSPNELLMRLRCAYASAAASHNDMEAEGEEVDWDLIEAGSAATQAATVNSDGHSTSNAPDKTGVQRFGQAVVRALQFTKRKPKDVTSSKGSSTGFSSRSETGWRRRDSRSSADSMDSVNSDIDGLPSSPRGLSTRKPTVAIRLDHARIRGTVERHWLSASPFEVEADTFFCFRALVRRMRRLFHCTDGLDETLGFLQRAFKLLDKPLHKHLMSLSPPLTPTFYSLPWLLTLFSQGVQWRFVQRMWDAFLTHDEDSENGLNVEFIVCFAIALARSLRALLLQSDFAGAIAVLHGALGSLNFNCESVLIVARDSFQELKKAGMKFQPTST